ncbi:MULTISPECIES: DUF1415 domain-containing protein [unclassified Neptuniibacter]|jgi:hypothetical protein|uniref:DUF1415 domain-containing protein n=1 Tax=unclassified Neptuniibacter TaxID=2630693 RepID=UPI0026E319A6|nr:MULTISPECIES: DUF1415 domain-containing protein [unclassified Neptuniibacter]MDO6513993.1 DUF1415 domain-containing protein [Neptuniibacter sp. 2_MG-2023]MDO6594165.1 DUF1415 domain-containing protein [Neptuniibacter sp. 1_MG-2023]
MNIQKFSFPAEEAATLTQQWVESIVVGLNLCPFAAPEVRKRAIRYCVSHATELDVAIQDFLNELQHIQNCKESELSTSLISFTETAIDFYSFLDLLDMCQDALEDAGLDGVFQLASFHPQYCFAGVDADHISNWTNRAPFPTIHIIREGQMSRVLMHYKTPEEIPERNIALMETLGREGLIERFPPLEQYFEK